VAKIFLGALLCLPRVEGFIRFCALSIGFLLERIHGQANQTADKDDSQTAEAFKGIEKDQSANPRSSQTQSPSPDPDQTGGKGVLSVAKRAQTFSRRSPRLAPQAGNAAAEAVPGACTAPEQA